MPALFVFLFKVNIALLLFSAGYYVVLRRLTFYTLNRVYLVAAILFATAYPLINLSDFASRHQQITQPVQTVIYTWTNTAQALAKPLAEPTYWYWLQALFWTGVALLSARLLMQLFSLLKLYHQSTPATICNHKVRVMDSNNAPFSFWRSIYINPNNHAPADLEAILLHEQIHVNQWHTLDVLLAELSSIFYWFNPGIWLMKKAVKENIEFITDRKILNKGLDSKQYQYSLVNVSFSAAPQTIVSHFNISTIKKRIIMMNAKRSSKFTLTRYAVLVPVVLVCLLCFSFSKAELIKQSKTVYSKIAERVIKLSLPANTVEVKKPAIQSVQTYHYDTLKLSKDIKLQLTAALDPNGKNLTIDSLAGRETLFGSVYNLKLSADKLPAYDTIKKVFTGEKLTGIKPVYIIDGTVVDKNIFNAISPEKIAAVNVAKSEDGTKAVVYITTKNADPSKRVDQVRINGVDLTGMTYVEDTVRRGKKIPLTGTLHAQPDSPKFVRDVVVRGYALREKTVSGYGLMHNENGYTVGSKKVTGYSIVSDEKASSFADKMVVIDGKIATEKDLKKISAFDIDRVTTKSAGEMTSLYGDKAKNGVVFIVTKKK